MSGTAFISFHTWYHADRIVVLVRVYSGSPRWRIRLYLEPGIGQFREFDSPRVHTRINSWGRFLAHKLTCGKRESVSWQHLGCLHRTNRTQIISTVHRRTRLLSGVLSQWRAAGMQWKKSNRTKKHHTNINDRPVFPGYLTGCSAATTPGIENRKLRGVVPHPKRVPGTW